MHVTVRLVHALFFMVTALWLALGGPVVNSLKCMMGMCVETKGGKWFNSYITLTYLVHFAWAVCFMGVIWGMEDLRAESYEIGAFYISATVIFGVAFAASLKMELTKRWNIMIIPLGFALIYYQLTFMHNAHLTDASILRRNPMKPNNITLNGVKTLYSVRSDDHNEIVVSIEMALENATLSAMWIFFLCAISTGAENGRHKLTGMLWILGCAHGFMVGGYNLFHWLYTYDGTGFNADPMVVEGYIAGATGAAILVASLIWAYFEFLTTFQYHMVPQLNEAVGEAKVLPGDGDTQDIAKNNGGHFWNNGYTKVKG